MLEFSNIHNTDINDIDIGIVLSSVNGRWGYNGDTYKVIYDGREVYRFERIRSVGSKYRNNKKCLKEF